ncbi:hypothetical protein L228DRAFT_210129 [Xylona heveae TC161]|uniref:Sister chromatid cohesion protein n=1 Tax=Xylona heveae (strain CBS 132557 / TC161) TaxID=1328760 RepID=A0A161TC20_XYLHT|nr:hypothetical protein L228DRAFT_210129 [Xylona heveae TC161]KZF23287.1 hypothetical protein L228DRAFT_210129 [Xylona heveae TC161]
MDIPPHLAGGAPRRHRRPLTVDEALQYTPLSSIPPFGPGALLAPTPGIKSLNALDSPRTPTVRPSSTPAQPSILPRDPKMNQDSTPIIQVKPPTADSSVKPGTTPSIVLPQLSPTRQTQYQTFPDVDESIKAEAQRAMNSKSEQHIEAPKSQLFANGPDSRARSEACIRHAQDLMFTIFEAEDRLQPDTSGLTSTDDFRVFLPMTYGESDAAIISPEIQSKLESGIQKVSTLHLLHEIPVEHLSRLQKICEGALGHVDTLNLKLEDGAGADEVERFLQKLEIAQAILRSARLSLRILTGGREEKQLYAEGHLQSVLNCLKNILETCVVPVVEMRSSGEAADNFKALSSHKKQISTLLHHCGKVLTLLADLLVKVEVSEQIVTMAEFMASALIFVENAPNEKESILGIQKFELLRRVGMDVLAKIFSKYPDQRTFIFDEILSSLEKLPVTRQSARQYKLDDGKSIQLVSALIMRLVQSSSTADCSDQQGRKSPLKLARDDIDNEDSFAGRDETTSGKMRTNPSNAVERLIDLARPLHDNAYNNAHYVIKYLVQRGQTSSKSGDQPYRNLLDIFTEDFVIVLNSVDWPAAELLLRALLVNMISISESEKSSAPAKNMALDLMGLMGTAISDVISSTRQMARNLEINDLPSEVDLGQLAEEALNGKLQVVDLLGWKGPYRIALEHLRLVDIGEHQNQSIGFLLMQWAKSLWTAFELLDEHDREESMGETYGRIAFHLEQSILDITHLYDEGDRENQPSGRGRLAYSTALLNMPFCKLFDRVLSILLRSMSSDQATVRSRSLKSIVQLLDKDATILDRGAYVMRHILACAMDKSPLVRDSAISLLGKCLQLKPTLHDEIVGVLLPRTGDPAIGVRKRTMKLLKDIYLSSSKGEVKVVIADNLLQRVKDTEESVCELALQILEEVWMSPFYNLAEGTETSVTTPLSLRDHVALIVNTAQRGDAVSAVLESLLRNLLRREAKNSQANNRVCKIIVNNMFDNLVDSGDSPEKLNGQSILQTLTIFAKANARLFDAEQLELLQPYVENLSNCDDLVVYRSIIVIFRHTFPFLPRLQQGFLKSVQDALLKSISRLGKNELKEVVPCLWTINGVLRNTDRLAKLTISSIKQVHAAKAINFADAQQAKALIRVKRYMMISGAFGQYCNFENDPRLFKESFPWWKGTSVSGLLVDILTPFTNPKQPLELRKSALDSVGMICQAWPRNYLKEQVNSAFEIVFAQGDRELEEIVLRSFKGFLLKEEQRSEDNEDLFGGDGTMLEGGRLENSLVAGENDGVSTSIAQRFLGKVLRVALASQDGYALIAAEILGSINRQGLVHPKELGPTLVALETSGNAAIASLALAEHRVLHSKHESMLEKEYMRAVNQAFLYQRDTLKDLSGARSNPCSAKLKPLFEVIKTGNGKLRRKFLSNLCAKLNFEPGTLEVKDTAPVHLQFVRFVVENISFFDYGRLDELQLVVACLEKIVAGTGAGVAHAIETDVLQLVNNVAGNGIEEPKAIGVEQSKNLQRLQQLTAAAMILSLLWETRTFLRRLYGLQSIEKPRESKGKGQSKDLTKAPIKTHSASGESYLSQVVQIMASLENSDSMSERCKRFVALLSIDDELKVAAEDEEDLDPTARLGTPIAEEEDYSPAPPSADSRSSKRKGSFLADSTPKKARRGSRPSLALAFCGLFVIFSGTIILAIIIYDAIQTREDLTHADIPVAEMALNPRTGGPKNLPIAEILVDDEDTPDMVKQKDKPRLVILGSGWGSVALLKTLNPHDYHVTVVSPINYFLFTPMLPSATVGTLELRSLVEPIRRIVKRIHGHFLRARAEDIDFSSKLLEVSQFDETGNKRHFYLPYDKLVIAVGIRSHILNTYDEALSRYAEERFAHDDVQVMTNSRVEEVKPDRIIFTQKDDDGKIVRKELPMGFCLWSTGVTQTPFCKKISDKLGDHQQNRHALETDTHLRLIGAPLGDVYAVGDCATVQNNVADHLVTFLRTLAWEKGKDPESMELSFGEWRNVASRVKARFPQAADHLRRVDKLFEQYDLDKSGTLDFGELTELLKQIDSKLTSLPATAQRAHQQGQYLGRKFTKIAHAAPGMMLNQVDYGDLDEAVYKAFDYKHLGSLAYIGNAAIFDINGHSFGGGLLAVYLWRSIYFAQSVSLRTRILLGMDWTKRALFGRGKCQRFLIHHHP